MNLLGWVSKAKDNELKKKENAAQDEAIRLEWLNAWCEFWQQVLDTSTERRASTTEFSDSTIELISTIIREKWFSKLPRNLEGWRSGKKLHIYASENHENPLFYLSIGGWPLPHSYRTLPIGHYSDGVDVLKSRYDLVDTILQRGHEKVMAYEIEEIALRKQMLDSIQDIINDAS